MSSSATCDETRLVPSREETGPRENFHLYTGSHDMESSRSMKAFWRASISPF
jgi:hypothetical protein